MNLIQTQILFHLVGKQLKNILKTVAENDFYIKLAALLWKHISSWSNWLW